MNQKQCQQVSQLFSPMTGTSKIKYKRKFPGPAGLIPISYITADASESSQSKSCSDLHQDIEFGSESSWNRFLIDVSELKAGEIHHRYFINSIEKVILPTSSSLKAPIFSAVISHIDCSFQDKIIVLKDPTGEVRGYLHGEIWDKYKNYLSIGSTLLLYDLEFSLIKYRNMKSVQIMIIEKNIAKIYSPISGDLELKKLADLIIKEEKTITDDKKDTSHVLTQEDLDVMNETLNGIDVDDFYEEEFLDKKSPQSIPNLILNAEDADVINETLSGMDMEEFYKDAYLEKSPQLQMANDEIANNVLKGIDLNHFFDDI